MNLYENSFKVLKRGHLDNGIFVAAPSEAYLNAWIRDNVMICLAFIDSDCDTVERNVWRWLDMLIEYDPVKLDYHTRVAPKLWYEHIHVRYSAHEVKEIDAEWSHCQLDALGGLLYLIGEGLKRNKKMIRNERDREIVQKLVLYLQTIRFWDCDEDVGPWEEQEGKGARTSSIAACVAGLRGVKDIVDVPEILIENGMDALYELFPYETKTRKHDLAQLTAIYPYRVFGDEMNRIIVENIEKNLLRKNGVLRYERDSYFSILEKQYGRNLPSESYIGEEAEWVFGYGYLAIAWMKLGDYEKAKEYIELFESAANEKGEFPELYMADGTPNENTPLLWTHAVYINTVQKYQAHMSK